MVPSSRVEPTAAAPSKTIGVKLGRESFECDEVRCKGSFGRGALRFDVLEEGARVRYGSDAEVALVDLGPKQSPRYRVAAPDLDAVFAGLPIGELSNLAFDETPVARFELTLLFRDGAVGKANIPLSNTGARLALFERLESVANGPVRFASDDEASPAPRAMWVQFPMGLRGSASSLKEIDWLLLIDEPSRPLPCERMSGPFGHASGGGKVEKATFSISDVRGRIYERRSGVLLGEKLLPANGAPSCDQLFAWRDQDVGGIIGRRDTSVPKALADWAWNTFRPAR